MLFSLSLADKLGSTGLQSYSLHPGVIFDTNLGAHIDWNQDGVTLRESNCKNLLGCTLANYDSSIQRRPIAKWETKRDGLNSR